MDEMSKHSDGDQPTQNSNLTGDYHLDPSAVFTTQSEAYSIYSPMKGIQSQHITQSPSQQAATDSPMMRKGSNDHRDKLMKNMMSQLLEKQSAPIFLTAPALKKSSKKLKKQMSSINTALLNSPKVDHVGDGLNMDTIAEASQEHSDSLQTSISQYPFNIAAAHTSQSMSNPPSMILADDLSSVDGEN
jgi:hypothetical protein